MDFQIVYTPDEGGFNALEPVTGTTSWGETLSEAKEMITEALELYFSEVTQDDGDTAQLLGAADSFAGAVHIKIGA